MTADHLDLDAIQARADAATQGTWTPVAGSLSLFGINTPDEYVTLHDNTLDPRNAEFIAHARTDISALVAEVRTLRANLEQTVEQRDALRVGGVGLIAAERATHPARGYDAAHDAEHHRDLVKAAIAYLWHVLRPVSRATDRPQILDPWPWAREYWKPRGPRRTLVKAGALIAAAIDALPEDPDAH